MGRPWQGKTGRKQTKKTIHKKQGKLTSSINVHASLDELDDDIDKFHKESDNIPLDVNNHSGLSEDEMEDPVFSLKGESSEDEAESEDEDLEEEELSGLAAKIAKQAKILEQKTTLMEDEDEEGEEQDEKEKRALWGKRKKMYYSADNVDYELQSSDDEEALREEEAEALRLQRLQAESLRHEDFELDDEVGASNSLQIHDNMIQEIVESQEAIDNQKREHDASKRRWVDGFAKGAEVFVEEVNKDLNALSKAEQMDVVMSDAPELVGLLADLKEGLDELQHKVEPLLNKVKGEHLANNNGISFLESKHMLLLCYCQTIVFYLLMKAEGRSVRDHPVIARLVEIRMLLDKFQPLDKKLHDQVGKLMSLLKEPFRVEGTEGHLSEAACLNQKQGAELGFEANNIFCSVPTVNSATVVRGDSSKAKNPKYHIEDSNGPAPENDSRNLEDKLEKIIQVIAPESKEMLKERAKLDSHLQDNLKVFGDRLILKSGQQKLNQRNQLGNGLMNWLDDFNDEITDFVGMKEDGGKLTKGISSRKLSQIIAESGHQSKKPKIVSGDADLPVRENLGERRAKLEMWKASQVDYGKEEELEEQVDAPLEEDEFYLKAKEERAAKQAAKELKYARIPDAVLDAAPVVEEETGKRHISYQMEKNKGLTPHRKRLTKNPRKKYKLKHQKALIRRKGQVREVKVPAGPYGGESTGIRSSISRSIRFHT